MDQTSSARSDAIESAQQELIHFISDPSAKCNRLSAPNKKLAHDLAYQGFAMLKGQPFSVSPVLITQKPETFAAYEQFQKLLVMAYLEGQKSVSKSTP